MRDVAERGISGEKIFRDFAERAGKKSGIEFVHDGVNFIFRRRNAARGITSVVGRRIAHKLGILCGNRDKEQLEIGVMAEG